MIKLLNIDKNNYEDIINLCPGQENKKYIAENAYSIVQFIYENMTGDIKGIYLDETPIGFVMITTELKPIYIHRLMIDHKYQNKGYGKKSFMCVIDYIKNKYNPSEIFLSSDNPLVINNITNYGFKPHNGLSGKFFLSEYNEHLFVYNINYLQTEIEVKTTAIIPNTNPT